jgi:hypothetical protein
MRPSLLKQYAVTEVGSYVFHLQLLNAFSQILSPRLQYRPVSCQISQVKPVLARFLSSCAIHFVDIPPPVAHRPYFLNSLCLSALVVAIDKITKITYPLIYSLSRLSILSLDTLEYLHHGLSSSSFV